jgi:3',5'-nucleoside bisphosphate phosphatase
VAASRAGLAALAITDHDTVSALSIARPEAARWGVELIAGVELTCAWRSRELHLLGYFIDDGDAQLCAALARLRATRVERFEAMAAKLEQMGIAIDRIELRRAFPRATLGRRHLARYLELSGQVSSARHGFALYLGDGCPACVDKPRVDIEQGITLIRNAGGVAALAHPPLDLPESALQAFAGAGLQALEVDGPRFSLGKNRRLRTCAERLNLIGVVGSDFHAPAVPGRWIGAVVTPEADLARLRNTSRPAANECRSSNSPSAIACAVVE